jgi:hypothetical protein
LVPPLHRSRPLSCLEFWHTGGVSQGGGWDQFEGWVPGDREPSQVPSGPPPGARVPPPPMTPPSPGGARVSSASSTGQGPVPQGNLGGPGIIAGLLAVLVLAGAGVAAFAAFSAESASTDVVVVDQVAAPGGATAGEVERDRKADRPAGDAGVGEPDAEPDLLRGSLQPALAPLIAELGPSFRLKSISIYPGYASFETEPPGLPGELDRWTVYLPDRVSGPDPVTNPGDIEQQLFPLDQIDLGLLATLPDRAEEVLAEQIPGGEAGYTLIGWSTFDEQVAISVYVRTERRSGYVRFTTAGDVLFVYGG